MWDPVDIPISGGVKRHELTDEQGPYRSVEARK
jgi:hypothetical protein